MGAWLPILLTGSMHRPVLDPWSLSSPWQTLTSRSRGGHSGPPDLRARSVPDPVLPLGSRLSFWEAPLKQQPLVPISSILAGESREKETPYSGHGFAAAVICPQGGGLHGGIGTSPLASHQLNAWVSPAPWLADMNLNPSEIYVLRFGNGKRRWAYAKGHDWPRMEKTKSQSQGCQEEGLTVFSMVTNLMPEEHIWKEVIR